jgi:hypothetical protein
MSAIRDLIDDFVNQLSAALEGQVVARARQAVEAALAGRAGRNAAHVRGAAFAALPSRPRKKAPIQLCPVPGCTERAAPIFGMVCSKHKDVPKTKIKQYREARRAQKVGGAKRSAVSAAAAATRKKPRKPPAKKRAAAAAPARKPPARKPTRPTKKIEVVQRPQPITVGPGQPSNPVVSPATPPV